MGRWGEWDGKEGGTRREQDDGKGTRLSRSSMISLTYRLSRPSMAVTYIFHVEYDPILAQELRSLRLVVVAQRLDVRCLKVRLVDTQQVLAVCIEVYCK